MEKEKPIYFKELILRILLKWKVLLVWMLVFAILSNGYGCLRSYQNVKTTKEQMQKQQQGISDYTHYLEGMTQVEINEVEDAVESYISYEETYNNYEEYSRNSIKMKIDPAAVPTIQVIYKITDTSKADEIINACKTINLDEKVCNYISEKNKWNVDSSYIQELVTIENLYKYQAESGDKSQKEELIEIVDGKNKTGQFVVKIISNNKDTGEVVKEESLKQIESFLVNLKKEFGDFSVKKIHENFYYEVNKNLLYEQKEITTDKNNITLLMRNMKASFSEVQYNYFLALTNDKFSAEVEENDDAKKETIIAVPSMEYVHKKYIVLGLMAGLILGCVYLSLKSIMSKQLSHQNLIKDYFGIDMLGVLVSEKTKNTSKVERFLINNFNKDLMQEAREEKIKLISSSIQIIAHKKGMKHIHVTGTADLDTIKKMGDLLSDVLDTEITVGGSVSHDAYSLNNLINGDGVVFVEEVGKSTVEEITHEINMSKKYGINIIGAIVLR